MDRFIPYINEGQVVKTDDPDQMGRVKIWVPALDGESFDIDYLPWAEYAPMFAGFTTEYPGGNGDIENDSHASYGFWAIPKIGATVYVFCLGGDPTRRVFFAASVRLHRNRSLPAGRNIDSRGRIGPWGDAGDENGNLNPIQPAFTNLREQFSNKLDQSESITRGAYERQVAQPKFDKDGTEGYSKTPIKGENYLDAQTYCFVTPGRHALIFQDDPKHARLRLKTGEGHQIIFDDANERIYISTAKGKSWVELDLDGHVHLFGTKSVSIRAGEDINLFADKNINLEAGIGVNIKANKENVMITAAREIHLSSAEETFITACKDIHMLSDASIKITSKGSLESTSGQDTVFSIGRALDVTAASNIKIFGARLDLNGPKGRSAKTADCAKPAAAPSVVPGHEPWSRPVSPGRNQNWKP
jgi:phage gp45-like